MAKVTFLPPIANISGRLSSDSKIVLRTRNGRTQAYIIEHPYAGPVKPQRQRTINSFKEAVNQSKTILADPVQKAEWQKRYKKHKDYFRRHPSSPYKRYSTLRGFVIAQLMQQINAQAKQTEVAESKTETTSSTVTTQATDMSLTATTQTTDTSSMATTQATVTTSTVAAQSTGSTSTAAKRQVTTEELRELLDNLMI